MVFLLPCRFSKVSVCKATVCKSLFAKTFRNEYSWMKGEEGVSLFKGVVCNFLFCNRKLSLEGKKQQQLLLGVSFCEIRRHAIFFFPSLFAKSAAAAVTLVLGDSFSQRLTEPRGGENVGRKGS